MAVGSRDISQAEKEITACKVEQIHKLTTIFTQKDNLGPFWMKVVVILWIFLAYQKLFSEQKIIKKIGCFVHFWILMANIYE